MKSHICIILLIFVLMLSIVGIGQAQVVDELITIPTADLTVNKGLVKGEVLPEKWKFGMQYRVDSRLELGADVSSYREGHKDMEAAATAKLLLAPEAEKQPAVAAGIKSGDLYIAFSKQLGYGTRGHIGIGSGQYDGIFFGINKVLNPVSVTITEEGQAKANNMPPINLMAEFANQKLNFGLRFNMNNNINLDIGVIDLQDFKAGVSYTF